MIMATEPSTSSADNYKPITYEEYEAINIATQDGLRRLAELAADGPIFKVRHACDTRAD
jgi:hypothetical protein